MGSGQLSMYVCMYVCVKIISQTENVVKEITVHVISVLVVD